MLSKFGLVPAAALGLDVEALIEAAQKMERACGADVPPAENVRCTARRCHGHCGNAFRPRQGDGRCLAGDRLSGRVAGTASGRKHRQARPAASLCGLVGLLTAPERYGGDRSPPWSWTGRLIRGTVLSSGSTGAGRPSSFAKIRVKDIGHISQDFSAGRSRLPLPARSLASIRSISRMSKREEERRAR